MASKQQKRTKRPKVTQPDATHTTRSARTADKVAESPEILADHIYRGPHHGADGVSDLRVVSVGPGKDAQGKSHRECVTVEPTHPPHRQVVHAMGAFRSWAVKDVTEGYEKIPKKGKGEATGKGGA